MERKLEIQDARIGFRNFSGRTGKYDKKENRSFSVFLAPEDAERLAADGWNIKYTKNREDPSLPGNPYLTVFVSYKPYPPREVMIVTTGENPRKTLLDESMIGQLDYADIERCDLLIRPYNWEVNGERGKKAMLYCLYAVVYEYEVERRYHSDGLPF